MARDDLTDLQADFKSLSGDVGVAVDLIVKASATAANAIAMAICPFKSGNLKRAHEEPDFDGGPRHGYSRGEIGPIHELAPYAKLVHDGTSQQAPQPWLDRAADVVEPGFYAAMEAATFDVWSTVRRHRG